MNNHIKLLANGDFEVRPLDDPERIKFEENRNYQYETMKCLECNNPATWVRSTQFAGEHPYCKEHAEKESDFGENDSYAYWYETRTTE